MKYLLLIMTFASSILKVTEATISIDVVGESKNVWMPDERKVVKCIANKENHKVEWISPQGEKVVNNKRIHTKTMKSGLKLIFTRTSMTDNGVWQCRSGDMVQNLTICVIDPTKLEIPGQEIISENIGSSIKLRCRANFGDPEPKLEWYRNGIVITDNNNTKYKTLTVMTHTGIEGQLTVVSIDAYDAGPYTCRTTQEISDECVLNSSVDINLKVILNPSLFDEQVTKFNNSDESIQSECIPKGKLMLDKNWLWEDEDDEDDPNLKEFHDGILAFEVTKKHIGVTVIYTAKDEKLAEDDTYHFMKISKINQFSDHKTYISLYIVLPDVVNSEIEGIHIEYLKRNSYSERKLNWKTADGVIINRNNSKLCDKDEYVVIIISGLLQGTKYWIRLRTLPKNEKDLDSTIVHLESTNDGMKPSNNTKTYYFENEDLSYTNISINLFIGITIVVISLIIISFATIICCLCQWAKHNNNTLPIR